MKSRKFNGIPPYSETESTVPKLVKFSPMIQNEIRSTIMSMKSKQCELDPIPTAMLKALLPVCLEQITQIVNISLTYGEFSEHWKTSIVRPLLKKIGLDVIFKNFRLVSNLNFLSKLVEKCVLSQFNDHCAKYALIPEFQSAY